MQRHFDGQRMTEDVRAAVEVALAQHGVQVFSLLGVTTILEAMASPMKAQWSGILGRRIATLGVDTYLASTVARRVALLQSPHSVIVNPLMESIAEALQRAKEPLTDEVLRLAAYRIFLSRPRVTVAGAERQAPSLRAAYASARQYLVEGQVISRDAAGRWGLPDMLEITPTSS